MHTSAPSSAAKRVLDEGANVKHCVRPLRAYTPDSAWLRVLLRGQLSEPNLGGCSALHSESPRLISVFSFPDSLAKKIRVSHYSSILTAGPCRHRCTMIAGSAADAAGCTVVPGAFSMGGRNAPEACRSKGPVVVSGPLGPPSLPQPGRSASAAAEDRFRAL